MSGRTWRAAVAIALCALAFYANSFSAPFIGLDDKQSIRDNPHIRSLWPVSEAISLPLWNASGAGDSEDKRAAIARRPVLSLSFALTQRLSGFDPRGHHAVNLAIHAAAALVLFGILRRTLARASGGGFEPAHADRLALAAALLWMVHPLQTESVTFVIQRAESLSGLFVLLTLYCALRSFEPDARRGWQAAALAASALGMGVKETTIVAPLLVLLYDRLFVSPSIAACLRGRTGLYVGLALTALIAPALASGGRGDFSPEDTLAYALAQPRVILHYLRLAFWPEELFVYVNTRLYDVATIRDAAAPALVLLLLAAATAWALVRRPLLGFAGAWFFLTLAPTSSVLAISDTIQEHRMYLALLAPVLLAVLAGDAAMRAWVLPRLGERTTSVLGASIAAVAIVALGLRTYDRNRDYHREFAAVHPADLYEAYTVLVDHYASDPDLLAAEAGRARVVLASPDADARDTAFAHLVLGFAHEEEGNNEDAVRELARVVELHPQFAYAHRQLGAALRDQEDLDGAVAHLEEALRLAPRSVYTHKELAIALDARGDADAARRHLGEALRIKPDFAEAYYELGVMAAERNDLEEARAAFRRAIRHRPDFADAHFELAHALEASGHPKRALAHLAHAGRADPEFAMARVMLARRMAERGEFHTARRELRRAARRDTELAEAHHELGLLLLRAGEPERAARRLRRALASFTQESDEASRSADAKEELARVHNALGMALARQGAIPQAEEHFREAVELWPGFAQAHTELGGVLRTRGDLDGAVRQLREAIRLEPKSAGAYKELGIVMRDRSDLTGAAEQLEKAVALDPDYADAHNELGWIRFQQGHLQAAAAHFERALAVRADFSEARERLEEVRSRLAAAGTPRPQSQP